MIYPFITISNIQIEPKVFYIGKPASKIAELTNNTSINELSIGKFSYQGIEFEVVLANNNANYIDEKFIYMKSTQYERFVELLSVPSHDKDVSYV